jgi:DNA polymerase III delta subunit
MVTNAEKLSKGRIEDLAKLQGIASSSLKVVLVLGILRPSDAWTRAFPMIGIDPMKSADAVRWVMDRYGLTPDVARYVIDSIGSDLYPLHNEIEKLRTYVGAGKSITNRDVDELVLRSEQFGPYELGDAILARDYRRSVQVAGAMLADGAEPLMMLGLIIRVWRNLFVGKGLASQRSPKEVAAAVGIPSFKAGEFVAGCKKYEWRQLVLGFREILNVDRTLKSSSPDVEACFDVMLWKMTN